MRARVIAVVGAECTGKTTLAVELAEALGNLPAALPDALPDTPLDTPPDATPDAARSPSRGGPRVDARRAPRRRVACVGEYLREWCDDAGRTPRREEQAAIAAEQTRRIEAAAQSHDMVVCDTTALMTAVYSELIFDDLSLYDEALRHLATTHVRLLTAPDLPWQADGIQRDGPQVRAPVDALLRRALATARQPFAVIYGQGPQRLAHALAAVTTALQPVRPAGAASGWQHACDLCGDAGCERHLFTRLARNGR